MKRPLVLLGLSAKSVITTLAFRLHGLYVVVISLSFIKVVVANSYTI